MTGVLICNGRVSDYSFYNHYFSEAEIIICADGGADHARKFGITPHVIVGDLDSADKAIIEHFRTQGVEILKYPTSKDMTDTEIAIELAAERGVTSLVIIGGVGSRLDHSLSNVFHLRKLLEKGIRASLVDESNSITLIKDKIIMDREPEVRVTLLPVTDAVEGVTTRGLMYPLSGATLKMGSSWGVSNEFADEKAEVSIKSGLLLVIRSRD